LALACLGAWAAWRAPGRRGLAWAGLFVATFLAAVATAGHEYPPGSGRVSERLAQVPAVAMCALAGLGLGAALEGAPKRFQRLACAGVAAVLLLQLGNWVRFTRSLIRETTSEPGIDLAYQVARMADGLLARHERLAVIAPPVDTAAIEDYVRKVGRSGGDAFVARAVARALAGHSPDADRVAANLARPPATVVEDATRASLIVVYDDAPAPGPPPGILVGRVRSGARGASLYRRSMR
jgi:hypothetical protein